MTGALGVRAIRGLKPIVGEPTIRGLKPTAKFIRRYATGTNWGDVIRGFTHDGF